jgi:hypothetical protein
VGGTIYNTHTLKPFKQLNLNSQRVKKLASKLHVHSVNFAAELARNRRALSSTVINSHHLLFLIILNSATLNTFLLAPSSAGRGNRTISGKQRIGFGAAAGAQQLYSSITQARSGTATPLNSKAHITARGTFDG